MENGSLGRIFLIYNTGLGGSVLPWVKLTDEHYLSFLARILSGFKNILFHFRANFGKK